MLVCAWINNIALFSYKESINWGEILAGLDFRVHCLQAREHEVPIIKQMAKSHFKQVVGNQTRMTTALTPVKLEQTFLLFDMECSNEVIIKHKHYWSVSKLPSQKQSNSFENCPTKLHQRNKARSSNKTWCFYKFKKKFLINICMTGTG